MRLLVDATMRPPLEARDPFAVEPEILRVWRETLKPTTIRGYVRIVLAFKMHCQDEDLDPIRELTLDGATAFALQSGRWFTKTRPEHNSCSTALHAWWFALRTLGKPVPSWRPAVPKPTLPKVLTAFRAYRQEHRGVGVRTLALDAQVVGPFLRMLQSRARRLRFCTVADVDAFVSSLSRTACKRTVANYCGHLRAFLRFLHATKRIRRDLAFAVAAPRFELPAHSERALSWPDVRRILASIDRNSRIGRRDYAILLTMATYGMGGAEIARLQLEDIDWRGSVLRVRRQKTGVVTELPLLPTVARALTAYLRDGRQRYATTRHVFLAVPMPCRPLTAFIVAHQVRAYARRAGVHARHLGSHTLRHSHATRQVNMATHPKVVSDILGHTHPRTLSRYTRVALERLKTVALPVPR